MGAKCKNGAAENAKRLLTKSGRMRIIIFRCETQRHSGDYGERVPPVPIPNTEVKPFSADGTWLETARESRTLPDSI